MRGVVAIRDKVLISRRYERIQGRMPVARTPRDALTDLLTTSGWHDDEESESLQARRAMVFTGSCHLVRVNGGHWPSTSGSSRDVAPSPRPRIDTCRSTSHRLMPWCSRTRTSITPDVSRFLSREGYANTISLHGGDPGPVRVMLADSAHIQEKDAEYLTRRSGRTRTRCTALRDVAAAIEQMISTALSQEGGDPARHSPDLRGSRAHPRIGLGDPRRVDEGTPRRLVFSAATSADQGSRSSAIRTPRPGLDVVIMESTYGNRDHPPHEDARGDSPRSSPHRRPWRKAPDSRLRRGTHPGARVRPARARPRRQAHPRDPDLHRFVRWPSRRRTSSRTPRFRSPEPMVRTRVSGTRSSGSTWCSSRRDVERLEGDDASHGADDCHRGLGNGRGRAHPAPPDANGAGDPRNTILIVGLHGRTHAGTSHRGAAANDLRVFGETCRCARRWRCSAATVRTRTAPRCRPGWRRRAPPRQSSPTSSWFTAKRRRRMRFRNSLGHGDTA
jgi:hypothetical protein